MCRSYTVATFAALVPLVLLGSFGFPTAPEPRDNQATPARVELGRHLFYDTRLSLNNNVSCATCHQQKLAFTDGVAHPTGTTGVLHPRSSMSLVNVAYAPALTWNQPGLDSLEAQALIPLFGTEPVEMGMADQKTRLLTLLAQDPTYRKLFPAAFPGETQHTSIANLAKAIAAFERSIVSMRSPYDRYRYNHEQDAISPAAHRGEILFFSSEKAGCFQCHGGWNFSGSVRFSGGPKSLPQFHNTGLSSTRQLNASNGRFRTPTLRNIAVTAPYMHDGSIATLAGVLDHYSAGGSDGHPHTSPILQKFRLSEDDKADLIAFLESLTDASLLTDPRWSNPWPQGKP